MANEDVGETAVEARSDDREAVLRTDRQSRDHQEAILSAFEEEAWTVHIDESCPMISGHRNAFQLAMKVMTAIAAKKAPELGTTTRQYAPKYPSPSTRAASSRPRGKLRKYWRNRNVVNPLKSTGTMIPW